MVYLWLGTLRVPRALRQGANFVPCVCVMIYRVVLAARNKSTVQTDLRSSRLLELPGRAGHEMAKPNAKVRRMTQANVDNGKGKVTEIKSHYVSFQLYPISDPAILLITVVLGANEPSWCSVTM